ncbi:MAG: hypothetical protein R3D68_07630 [Hyphomicrobiaceae bacterium]
MTTAAQVKRLVKPLLARHPDLALVGRMIVIRPVRHVLRAIYIDRTRSAAEFRPRWTAFHLFVLRERIGYALGGDVYKPRATTWPRQFPELREFAKLWWIEDPESPGVLAEAVEAAALPKLAPFGDLEAYYAHLAGHPYFAYHKRPEVRVIVEAARGRLDEVRAICRDELPLWPDNWFGDSPEAIEIMRRAKSICPLAAADDRAGIARLLHEWEAATVRNLKIEHLWQPTPFPLELDEPAG